MRTATTRPPAPFTLYLAFELGNAEWVLAMTTRMDQAPLRREMPARALKTLDVEIARAKAHVGLPATAPVFSCYEAGRDGFWLHRYLVSRGIANRIVDSSSIEVNRRRRRTKTDRLDAAKLVTMLMRAEGGEKKVWSVVHVLTGFSRLEGAARHCRRVSRATLLAPFVRRGPLLSLASFRRWRIHKVRVLDSRFRGRHG